MRKTCSAKANNCTVHFVMRLDLAKLSLRILSPVGHIGNYRLIGTEVSEDKTMRVTSFASVCTTSFVTSSALRNAMSPVEVDR